MIVPTLIVSDVCARCDGPMVAKPDAIGRIRHRCPRCDGVSASKPRHPDDAMMPQALVHLVGALPAVAPGQLRCQKCARGVAGRARFCADCDNIRAATPRDARREHLREHRCERCHEIIPPPQRGRIPRFHDACRTDAERRELARKRTWNERTRQRLRQHGRDGAA